MTPLKGVIRMIAGGPIGLESHNTRRTQVRETNDVTMKNVLDVEAMEDTPLIQFRRAERSGPKTSHNDALVITALLDNYEVGRVFIDLGSSTDILFGEAYDQMQLGDIPLEKVKQNKRHFGSEKDKIIQIEVDKLMVAGHIKEIQFPEWLSNVVLVPKLGGKWKVCTDFRDLKKACPIDFYPLPRIDQLVDSTSRCELLSMMDTS
ncbi:UNVERIFIED_CONTAM: hypothetical protein Slati_0478900 [Sesamum latifolium]|uniref:Uncharacterized protein n=1 Tax=Sesamum latifolium TaxID=2727402 RepID=A0AAW2XWK6_9LAMI